MKTSSPLFNFKIQHKEDFAEPKTKHRDVFDIKNFTSKALEKVAKEMFEIVGFNLEQDQIELLSKDCLRQFGEENCLNMELFINRRSAAAWIELKIEVTEEKEETLAFKAQYSAGRSKYNKRKSLLLN